ncbi:MAG: hypothetical protein KTR31_10855 [Myxococcales bacterium]|nr:hypothetical protein [Myxococcales bacterium]
MTPRLILACLCLVGCDRYDVRLERTSFAPVPASVSGPSLELPSGILTTVVAHVTKNGEPDDEVFLSSWTDDYEVLDVVPVSSQVPNELALLAVSPGSTTLYVELDVRRDGLFSWPATVVEQEQE